MGQMWQGCLATAPGQCDSSMFLAKALGFVEIKGKSSAHCTPQLGENMAPPSSHCSFWCGVGPAAREGTKFHESCICIKIVIY